MKYNYNPADNTIEIKDAMKMQLIVIFLVVFFNIVTGSRKLFKTYNNHADFDFLDIYWVFIMLASCIILIFMLMKRSYIAKIPVEQIKHLKEKSVFGKTQFYFELMNGKRRYLFNLTKESDIEELQKVLLESGIETLEQ